MKVEGIAFGTTDWTSMVPTEHPGITGVAYWRTAHFGEIRVRMVEYTPGYVADHWCSKGHILLCVSGELETELEDGRCFLLKPGMSYQVADNTEPHEPVRNFVCEAYHDPKEHVCHARQRRRRPLTRRCRRSRRS